MCIKILSILPHTWTKTLNECWLAELICNSFFLMYFTIGNRSVTSLTFVTIYRHYDVKYEPFTEGQKRRRRKQDNRTFDSGANVRRSAFDVEECQSEEAVPNVRVFIILDSLYKDLEDDAEAAGIRRSHRISTIMWQLRVLQLVDCSIHWRIIVSMTRNDTCSAIGWRQTVW